MIEFRITDPSELRRLSKELPPAGHLPLMWRPAEWYWHLERTEDGSSIVLRLHEERTKPNEQHTVDEALEIADKGSWTSNSLVNWSVALNAACVLAHELRKTRDVLAATQELLHRATSPERKLLEDFE